MIRWLAFVLLLIPVTGRAAPVPILSGDHPGFVRLVIYHDFGADWQLGRTADGWLLETAAPLEFDTARVFDRIGTDRLLAVQEDAPGVLALSSRCICHADSFLIPGRALVIDIKDGPAPADNPHDGMIDQASPKVSPPGPPAADLARAVDAAAAGPAVDGSSGEAAVPGLANSLRNTARVADFQKEVLDQLARAAAQGLLEPSSDIAGTAPSPSEQHVQTTAPGSAPKPAPQPPHAEDHAAMETAVDSARPDAPAPGAGLTDTGKACPDPASLDLGAWGHMSGGVPDFGKMRDGLTGEFDQPVPDRILALARFYLYLTFGAEARQVLDLLPPDSTDRARLIAMSEIVDRTGDRPVGAALDGYESCASNVALWSVLAGPPPQASDSMNDEAIVTAFRDLPRHVRGVLGPPLIERMLGADRLKAATLLRNAMSLSLEAPSPEAARAQAGVDAASGAPDKAIQVLDTALKTTDPDDPALMLDLAERRVDEGMALDSAMIGALQAVAYERRAEPIADRINAVLSRAAIAEGDWPQAREQLAGMDSAMAEPFWRDLYSAAADKAGSADFLRLVLPDPQGLGDSPLDRPARTRLAARLLDEGFPADALAVLGDPGTDHAARLLTAKATLATGRAEAALAILITLSGPEAEGVMGAAQERLGRLDLARDHYLAAGRSADAERVRLMMGDWPGLAGSPQPARRDLAGRLQTPAVPADPKAEPYSAADKLLGDSAGDRAAIEALLNGGT